MLQAGIKSHSNSLKSLFYHRERRNVVLTNKIYDLSEAKVLILYPLPQGER